MPAPSATSLGGRITQARIAAGFATPDAAAIRLGLDGPIYKRHESASYGPKADELRRIAEAFGVSIGWLSTGVGQGPAATKATVVATAKE